MHSFRAALFMHTWGDARGGAAHSGDTVRARRGFAAKAKRPKGHTPSSTFPVLLLPLRPASVESAFGNLLLLLVSGSVHGRPSLAANLPRAGAAVRGHVLSCPRLSFRAPASGFYGEGLFSLELKANRILQPCFSWRFGMETEIERRGIIPVPSMWIFTSSRQDTWLWEWGEVEHLWFSRTPSSCTAGLGFLGTPNKYGAVGVNVSKVGWAYLNNLFFEVLCQEEVFVCLFKVFTWLRVLSLPFFFFF